MSIYNPIIITEEIRLRFKPTRLYIKELNGVRYFGKTVHHDVERYSGSGVRWSKQVKKYGQDNILTVWVSEWFYSPEDIQEFALLFSELHNIVEDTEWANLKPETGLDGGGIGRPPGFKQTPETVAKILATKKEKGNLNSSTPERIAKRNATSKANGTNKQTPESIAKMIATKKAKGIFHNTPEMIAKMLETKAKNKSNKIKRTE